MDRRKFLTGVGTIGAAASAGTAALQTNGANARAAGLAKAARGGTTVPPPPPPRTPPGRPAVDGVALAFLPGSAAMVEPNWVATARSAKPATMKWARWDKSMAPASASLSRVLRTENLVSVSLSALQRGVAPKAANPFRSIEVVAHFAISDSSVVPFYAWQHNARTSSSPVTFDAFAADRMALQVDYALDQAAVASNVAATGMIYMPVGAGDGPGKGIYVLAGPSHVTGLQPDFASHIYTGDPFYPIVKSTGAEPDFDYVTIAIRPA